MIDRLQYRAEAIKSECVFETSRSSGKGGQHVNKTESRVTVVFNLLDSQQFSDEEKSTIIKNTGNRIKNGVLRVSSQANRSQLRNKEVALNRLLDILNKGLYVPKTRKKKKVSKSQKEARLKAKKKLSEKKSQRKKPKKGDL